MTGRNNNPESGLDSAIAALRHDEPDARALQAAGERTWERIQQQVGDPDAAEVEKIRGCRDIRALLPAYAGGRLAPARAWLVQDHLRECVSCRHILHHESAAATPWKEVALPVPAGWGGQRFALAAVVLIALGLSAFLVERYLATPSGPRATVASVDGVVYRLSPAGARLAAPGDRIAEGEGLRTSPGSHAFLRLGDGSLVEMNERSELGVSASRKDTSVQLDRGRIIVQAAKRSSGHLFVRTQDCNVAVTGTVFSVNSGTKGSRVVVIEGEVRVSYGGNEEVLHPGQQESTDPALGQVDLREEIAWSHNLQKHLALMAEFATLQKKLETLPAPQPLYSSRILPLVPADTALYVTIPNLGETLAQANQIFQQQMRESDVLRQWWEQNHAGGKPGLDEVIEKVRQLSHYLGDEVVFAAVPSRGRQEGPVVIAEVKQAGLREFLENEIRQRKGSERQPDIHVYDEQSLATATPGTVRHGVYILLRPNMIVAGPDLASVQRMNFQLTAGPTGFPATPFGQKVSAVYGRGAGLLIALDVQTLRRSHDRPHRNPVAEQHHEQAMQRAGFENLHYLLIERRDPLHEGENRAVLEFEGPRHGIASWLGAPAPMGSLDFISQNATLSLSFITKDPALMFDDLLGMAASQDKAQEGLQRTESQLNLHLREDLAATLGGDITAAVDGPVLPTPSWKLVAEVLDPTRLQASIQKLVDAANVEAARHNRPGARLEQEQVGARTFYVIRRLGGGTPQQDFHYTFADGYLIVAPSRALVMSAIQTHHSGATLARSQSFRALLPRDQHANFSALVYQNLGSVLLPLLAQLPAEQAQSLQKLAADNKPTIIAAYGMPQSIEVVTNSRFFGFDFKLLALSSLLEREKRGTAGPRPPY